MPNKQNTTRKKSRKWNGFKPSDILKSKPEKNKLIYKEYLGDGDTSSFNDVIVADPYKEYGIMPVKLECVGHVQKRSGTRLRNLVKAQKGTKKPNSGRGKLTENCINSRQNFYGLAIRSNVGNLYSMKKAVYAILFHFTDFSDSYTRHQFCPRGKYSWCKCWALNQKNYKPKSTIPLWIKDLKINSTNNYKFTIRWIVIKMFTWKHTKC